jgi:hypothetical protein
MPKTIMDYGKTIMYKIVCKDLSIKDCYIGHTTDMTKRKYAHKFAYNNEKDKSHYHKLYTIIRQKGGWDNWTMLLIEKFPCEDKHEARKRERQIIEQLGANLNAEDYKEELTPIQKDYLEQMNSYHKQRYQRNKAEIIEIYKEKIECKYCAKIRSKWNMTRHYKTCKSKPKDEN